MNNAALKLPVEHGDELEMLRRAFVTFNQSTDRLRRQYAALQVKLNDLNVELDRKNRELECNLLDQTHTKNYFKNILESLSTGVIVLDLEGQVSTVNGAAETIAGFERSEAMDREVTEAVPSLVDSGFIDPGCSDLAEKIRVGEGVVVDREGRKIHLSLNASEVLSSDGSPQGLILLLQDISEMKTLKRQAARNDRLVAMGEMAAGIAHEIRNPLGGIELYASMLRRDLADAPDKAKIADRICAGVRNLNYVISNLLTFTRSRVPACQSVDIHQIIDHAFQYAGHLVTQQSILLRTSFKADPPEIVGDRELLKQLVLNLVLNALQSMPEGGRLTIETTLARQRSFSRKVTGRRGNVLGLRSVATANRNNGATPASCLEIRISDTGCGIPSGHIEKIFNPFYTTRARGTGLGLAIVNNIVEAHKGRVEVESEQGKGTTFTVALPC